ncbi:MAG: CHAT domain-containing protein, partial [Gemmataceae bacterium]|nr:CHAT domain-containing protein [Gemmataceae bacterium]
RAALGDHHPVVASRLHSLGVMLLEAERPEKALETFQAALRLQGRVSGEAHPTYALVLNGVAHAKTMTGDGAGGLRDMRRALRIVEEARGADSPPARQYSSNLGILLRDSGDTAGAIALFDKALAGKPPNLARVLSDLAQARLDRGEDAEARKLLDRSLGLATGLLRAMSAAQSDRMQLEAARTLRFHLALRLSVPPASDDADACHGHVVAWKGAVQVRQQRLRLLARLAADPGTRAEAEELGRVTRLLAALAASADAPPAKLEETAAKQEELQARLAKRAGEREDRPPASAGLAALLPEGTALVDYLFFVKKGLAKGGPRAPHRHWLCAFVVRRGAPAVRLDLGAAEAVEKAVRAWRAKLEAGTECAAETRAVRALVWTPLEKHLAKSRDVLVSPDGVLGVLPFAALPGSKAAFLIEEKALAVLPVPQMLPALLAAKESAGKPSLLAAGGLDYGKGRWAPLPASLPEAEAVEALFRRRFAEGTAKRMEGSEGGKEAVRKALGEARYAHLATHGTFAPRPSALAPRGTLGHREHAIGWNPLLLSGIVLSGGEVLTALEASEMDLSGMELAVLSACETGLGKESAGEGMLGLQRAFAVAGCRSVVSSLWSVHDAATSVLMERFYHHLWEEKRTRIEALRRAQLDVMKNPERVEKRLASMRGVAGLRGAAMKAEKLPGGARRSPPAWWAAWQLSGDWR